MGDLTRRDPGIQMTLPLLCAVAPAVSGSTATFTVGGHRVSLRVDGLPTLAVERQALTDPQTRAVWGECLWRLNLTADSPGREMRWTITLDA